MAASPNSTDCHPVLEIEVNNSTSRYIKRRCDNIMCQMWGNKKQLCTIQSTSANSSSLQQNSVETEFEAINCDEDVHNSNNFEDNIASYPVSCNEMDATKLELDLYEELSLIGLGIGQTAGSVSLDPFMFYSKAQCNPAVYLPIICLAFIIKYNLSTACLNAHLRIINLIAEASMEEMQSAAKYSKKYEYLKQKVRKVFVRMNKKCDAILTSMGKNGFPTNNFQPCGHSYNKLFGNCYILTLPVEEQISYYLENGGADKWKKVSLYDGSTRGDIQSGCCYMGNIRSKSENDRFITLQLKVDGGQCFKSSKFIFWPFMAVINESSYRSRRSNMILMSLWYGNKKPPRVPFQNAALDELEELGNSGIYYPGLRFFVKPVVLTTDTMARSVFLNCIQFNGESGCDFCLHTDRQIKKGRGTSRIYPEPIDGPPFPPISGTA